MAVTITDRRVTITDSENVTGWTGVNATQSTDVAEQANAVEDALNIGNQGQYFTDGTGTDLSTSPGTMVYVYAFNNAIQPVWDASPPPQALLLGDGTDLIGFDMAGSNKRVFNHLDGPTSWQCLLLDTADATAMNSAGNTYVSAGAFATLTFSAITQWGVYYTTLSKALAGGFNISTDIIRYGNDGIRVTAGGSGTEGTCSELAAADRSTADGDAHGIFRELNPVSFGCQGPLTFGDSGAATQSRFIDSGVVIAFEDRNVADDKYYLNVEGNSGTTNVFELRASTITTAGPLVSMDMTSGEIDTLIFESVSFVNLGNAINFSNATDATGHSVTNCAFDGCGQIDPGDVTFEGNLIQNTTAGATGALLLDDDGSDNWLNLDFVGNSDGHGIYADSTGTYAFNDHTFTGFGADDTTNAAFYNDSGGLITLNVSGSSPTVRNGSGASTVINNAVTLAIQVDDESGNPVSGARVAIFNNDLGVQGSEITSGTTNSTGNFSDSAYNYLGDQDILIRVRLKGFIPFVTTGEILDTGFTLGVRFIRDSIVN